MQATQSWKQVPGDPVFKTGLSLQISREVFAKQHDNRYAVA